MTWLRGEFSALVDNVRTSTKPFASLSITPELLQTLLVKVFHCHARQRFMLMAMKVAKQNFLNPPAQPPLDNGNSDVWFKLPFVCFYFSLFSSRPTRSAYINNCKRSLLFFYKEMISQARWNKTKKRLVSEVPRENINNGLCGIRRREKSDRSNDGNWLGQEGETSNVERWKIIFSTFGHSISSRSLSRLMIMVSSHQFNCVMNRKKRFRELGRVKNLPSLLQFHDTNSSTNFQIHLDSARSLFCVSCEDLNENIADKSVQK